MLKFLDSAVAKKYREKICLLRVDLNIDPTQAGDILRVEAVLPTIQLLLKYKVKVVLVSHRGRPPVAKVNSQQLKVNSQFTLQPFTEIFSQKLGVPVTFLSHFNFPMVKRQLQWSSRKVFLLENIRFLPGEETNDEALARSLSELGNCYVNDAFAVSHRANASVSAITKFLPSYGGLRLKEELASLDYVMKRPKRPFTLILGGAKVGDKLPLIAHFLKKTDTILLGSGPACTFFLAQGLPVGNSIVDRNFLPDVKKLLKSKKIRLPAEVHVEDRKILDIGPRAAEEYRAVIKKSRTILWNGPMGLSEQGVFAGGTKEMWKAILENRRARTVIGGGETIASFALLDPKPDIASMKNIFLSTGGGAMLEYLGGKKLPGVAALQRASLAKSGKC